VDPAVEGYDLADMSRAQFIAMVRSFHLTVKPDVAGERRDFKDNSTPRPALDRFRAPWTSRTVPAWHRADHGAGLDGAWRRSGGGTVVLPCGSRNALILNRLWTIVRRLSLTAEALGATAKARCGCGAGTVLLRWRSHVDHATHWF
jgi:hypothetical protein